MTSMLEYRTERLCLSYALNSTIIAPPPWTFRFNTSPSRRRASLEEGGQCQ